MPSSDEQIKTRRPISRRSFLRTAAGGAALLGMPYLTNPAFASNRAAAIPDRPNILFLIVDQMREPSWFPGGHSFNNFLPSYSRIRRGAVNFSNVYSAATLCSPARAGLLTGLYTHQNGLLRCVDDYEPELNPGFKTWGGGLREIGYDTNWFGKWHLSYGDSLDSYGFGGGTFPSPNGGPQEGTTVDSRIVDQFINWFQSDQTTKPWATTVSLVNPHDIVYYYKYTVDYFKANPQPDFVRNLPQNFETAAQLANKPALQQAHLLASDRKYGVLPYSGDGWMNQWLEYLNAYAAFQQLADLQLGRVLSALDSRPNVRDNTIIIFVSDHGEYGGSHGLRGKGGSAYDEVIHVPLSVKDPTGRLTSHTHIERDQFVSLVDIFGLLLTIGSGSDDWRSQPEYSHVSGRLDVASILTNPREAGRSYVLHTYDEGGAKSLPGSEDPIPGHVIGLKSNETKVVAYNKWAPGTIDLDHDVQDFELYDYSTNHGRLELDNTALKNPTLLAKSQSALFDDAVPNELRQPLPARLDSLRASALQSYFDYLKADKKRRKLINNANEFATPTVSGE